MIKMFSVNYLIYNKFFKTSRSISPEKSFKKGILKNFAKFTGKHLCLLQASGMQLY